MDRQVRYAGNPPEGFQVKKLETHRPVSRSKAGNPPIVRNRRRVSSFLKSDNLWVPTFRPGNPPVGFLGGFLGGFRMDNIAGPNGIHLEEAVYMKFTYRISAIIRRPRI